jgi:hypothetical protein
MRSMGFVAALLFFLGSAGSASGQVLSIEFHDGRVKLTAENVPVSRILAEWTRVGGTQIVHGDRIPGAPLTLQLVDIPERQALDILLRNAAGYMVLARDPNSQGASSFEKIMVLATTSRAPAAAALPQPAPQPAQFREPEPIEEVEEDEPPAGAPPNFPRGRVPSVPPAQVPEDDDVVPEDDEAPPPSPGNPFGVVPGVVRPGTINAPQRNAPEAEQQPR